MDGVYALSFLEWRRITRRAFGFIRSLCFHRENICTKRKEEKGSIFPARKDRYSELSLKKRLLFTDSHTARLKLTEENIGQHASEDVRAFRSRGQWTLSGSKALERFRLTEIGSPQHWIRFTTEQIRFLSHFSASTVASPENGLAVEDSVSRSDIISQGITVATCTETTICDTSKEKPSGSHDYRGLSEAGGVEDARSGEASTDSSLRETSLAAAAGKRDGHAIFPLTLNSFDPPLIFRGNSLSSDTDLTAIFNHFCENQWAFEQALKCNISSVLFPIAVSNFQKFLAYRCASEPIQYLLKLGPSREADEFLFQLFAEYYASQFQDKTAKYESLIQTADLTKPHTWFPFARGMKRKFIYHCGPTNSGKTYNALKEFMEASSGVYCAPLRLLAMEVFDKVNAEGVKCSLHTGQEKKDVSSANHLACTIEMVTTQQRWEVAVIDEIQLLNEEYRGWAWTRAVLGLQADIIHLCGDPSVLDLMRRICATTGDQLEENFYKRFKPLSVETQSLEGNFCNVQPGDCIVVFSRRDIFGIKKAIERATPNRCCVVYGALPPETRRQQAKLFNDPASGYDVLIATDAVGMGLNLNIRRVVFYTFDKFNGSELKPVHSSQVKQIAGRAGRRGSLFPEGKTTTFYLHDLPYLVKSLEEPFSTACTAGLFPTSQQMELFAGQLPGVTFTQLLDWFAESCRVDGFYFLCRHDNIKKVAYIIDQVEGLSLEDRLNFCFSPVNIRDLESTAALFNYAQAYSQKLPVRLLMGAPTESAENDIQLLNLETKHQLVSLYLWLSQHFAEECFPDKKQAEQTAADVTFMLGETLVRSGVQMDTEYAPTKHVYGQSHTSGMLSSVLEVLRGAADESAPQKSPYSI